MKIIKDAIMRETDGAKEKLSFTRTEQAKVLNEKQDGWDKSPNRTKMAHRKDAQ